MNIVPRRGVHSWTLASSLALGFGFILALAVGVILTLSVTSGVATTFELLGERAVLLVSSIELQTREHLGPAREQANHLSRRLETGELDPTDEDAIGEALLNSMTPVRQLHSTFFVPRDLTRVIEVRREGDGLVRKRVDWTGNRVAEEGLKEIIRRREGYWGALVFDPNTKRSVINYRQPVWRGESLLGAIVTTVTTTELTGYLGDLVHDQSLTAFILVGRYQVLAHTTAPLANVKLSPDRPLPELTQVNDPVLEQIWNADNKRIGAFRRFTDFNAYRSDLNDDEHTFIYSTYREFGEVPWTFGVHLRSHTLLSTFRRFFVASFVGIGILTVALFGFFWLGHRLASPVLRLADAAEKVAQNGPTDIAPLPRSRIREIDTASLAFGEMVKGLKEREQIRETFGRYVPENLVDQLVGDHGVLGPQSRETTTLFTDIVGFSTVSEKMTPTGLIGMLNEYFAVVSGPIETHGGVIHQFQGDAILATFNSPTDLADHEAHAVAAALEIQALVMRTVFAHGVALSTRVGINTGEAVCGTVGSDSRLGFTVHGDEVNLAARLEQMNKDLGTRILISGSTVAAIRDQFEFTRVGVMPVRGRSQPVIVYRVAGPHTPLEAQTPEAPDTPVASV
jgi:class 3 adenylate cyclase